MKKQFQAKSLEEAFQQASAELCCSVTEIKYEVLRYPKKGFLGLFGKKDALIEVFLNNRQPQKPEPSAKHQKTKQKSYAKHQNHPKQSDITPQEEKTPDIRYAPKEQEVKQPTKEAKVNYRGSEKSIIDNFHSSDNDTDILSEVRDDLQRLFTHACFELDAIKVEHYDENTLYIEFTGKDAALLIGKEGYRYKALSYMLFNWINAKYNLMIRLEIAEFLHNQEEMIKNYLKPIIANIEHEGRAMTKPLDGVLVHIALKQLREQFPNKYVAIKINSEGERYIVINDFYKNQQ